MGSCLWDMPRMQVLLSKFKVFRHSLSMAWFGGATQKQTWLWSSRKFISGIDKFGKRPHRHKQKEAGTIQRGGLRYLGKIQRGGLRYLGKIKRAQSRGVVSGT